MRYKKSVLCILVFILFSSFNSDQTYFPENWDNSLRFRYRAASAMERYYEEFEIINDSIYFSENDPDTIAAVSEITQGQLNYLLGILKNQNLGNVVPIPLKSMQNSASFSIQLTAGDKKIIDFSVSKDQTLRSGDWNKHKQIISCIYKIINEKALNKK